MTLVPDLRHYTSQDRELLLDIHDEVYAELDDPLAAREAFAPFLDHWAARPGFACLIGYDNTEPVGFAYGAPLSRATTWWRNVDPQPDEDFTRETGSRTFALSELNVRKPWRGTGAARHIHDALIAGRPEDRVTLLVHAAHSKVIALYEQWGYRTIGETVPFAGAPPLYVMTRQLHT
ncbi:GNAT family N-acetyltransferase [Streptomyces sparsogenes]|uniref:GNAT family N-acetyltransferase n=1 Tax=Streptomyces sparsogenes TaxID=67365 RepID=UPI0033EC4C2D